MLYKGKAIEILGEKEVFGKIIAWIRILENGSFQQVDKDDLTPESSSLNLPYIRFISLAAKIKDEVAKKNILAPYESSLIPLPHQILVLEKVMQSSQNRFLLADEVGMGKTIETGLILKELKLRGDIKRILVIAPKSSMLQWQSELKEHFNEVFNVYDSNMITSMARTFSNINADEEFNFWQQHNQIIVSTDALKPLEKRQGWSQERVDEYNKYRMQAVLEADFDMVIIDEAHKMGGATSAVSRYVLAQELCNTVANVLLLTATPHRGKSDHFRRILQLLDPDAFVGEGLPEIEELEPYVIRTEKRLAVDYDGKKLFNERKTYRFDVVLDSSKYQKQIELYNEVTNYVRKGFNSAKKSKNNATGLIMILFQRLVSSSTAAILSAMKGRFERLQDGEDNDPNNYAEDIDNLEDEYNEIIDFDGVYHTDTEGLSNELNLLEELINKAESCISSETDAKADALLKKIEKLQFDNQNESIKVLVFTEFRTTQKMLINFLKSKDFSCAYIHGGQDLDERKRALSHFKNEAQILVATDAAGESLNMQFCHLIFNYDLPWNPMMIEQRIGRVDRIGQKNVVQAFNMLTNNSVDLRVYEVIEEKLNNIIDQLGIDKTADVLDSTIDVKKVNKLYLQSLLDPDKFEFAGEKWLHEIKDKLKDFQSTEGVLPQVEENEIESKKAAEIKYSPLPQWLESLILEYTMLHGGTATKNINGYYEIIVHDQSKKITFDSEISLNNPDVDHITLQHDWVRKILSDISEFNDKDTIPVLKLNAENETSGYWSLWQISAQNRFESKIHYQPFFITDQGKLYTAYANDIWSRLNDVDSKDHFEFIGFSETKDYMDSINEALYTTFQNIEADLKQKIEIKKQNKLNSFNFQKSRINKIGIENIKISKLKKLEKDYQKWISDFDQNQKIIPGTKQLLTFRLNGE